MTEYFAFCPCGESNNEKVHLIFEEQFSTTRIYSSTFATTWPSTVTWNILENKELSKFLTFKIKVIFRTISPTTSRKQTAT